MEETGLTELKCGENKPTRVSSNMAGKRERLKHCSDFLCLLAILTQYLAEQGTNEALLVVARAKYSSHCGENISGIRPPRWSRPLKDVKTAMPKTAIQQ